MAIPQEKLKKILIESGLITAAQFEEGKAEAEEKGKSNESILTEKDLISDGQLGRIEADILNFPYVNLRKELIPEDVLHIIPEGVARKQKIIAFGQDKNGLKLAMNEPDNLEIIEFIQKKTNKRVTPYFATQQDIKRAFTRYRKELKEEFKDIIKKGITEVRGLGRGAREMPIIKIVDTLLQQAYQDRASDLHLEPLEDRTVVRFRIDGILYDIIDLPKDIHDLLITRLKIMAKMRTDEHQAAQGGRFEIMLDLEKVDIRVSIIPISDGEKAVLRLLTRAGRELSLEELGLLGRDLKKIKENIRRPYGMILATGPTGCGKTTTLYSILKILNTREVNIATIEDPVEYSIEGVNQIQVNPKTNLTFAEGLKSIIRQDPNIIMVGEIRDEETAGIATNAAMTGHLVLSTLHTNNAATTLPRLLDMRVEPYLISSTVNIAIAQRLVRKICPCCIESYQPTEEELKNLKERINLDKILARDHRKLVLYRGKGCPMCHQTGYAGRIGIFEALEMKENIKDLVMKNANSGEIEKQAIANGMTTIFEDGIEKALTGITTIEEVLRVIQE